jgi:hypothetical protein
VQSRLALVALVALASPALAHAQPVALQPIPTQPVAPPPPAPSVPSAKEAGAPAGLGTNFSFGGGFAWFGQQLSGRSVSAGGVALTGRFEGEISPRIDLALSFTWGLTDWARAKEYVQAGNRVGQWTTDQFAKVEAWATKDVPKDQQGLRVLGAFFADLFLVLTYAAVPSCYVGSVGGATSHLQLDGTATFRLGDGPSFPFFEAGIGVAALPYQMVDWRSAAGPVLGAGMQIAGVVRVGGRMLWSPTGLNSAPGGGGAILAAITLSSAR